MDYSKLDTLEKLFIVCMVSPTAVGPQAPMSVDDPWGINLNVIGKPGVGKSKRLQILAKKLGAGVLDIHPIYCATKVPEHFGGYPVMGADGFSLQCALPQIREVLKRGGGILFLDEISSAPAAVQAAVLSLVNERTVGDYTLPHATRIVLAMNPADIAANGQGLETPFANRLLHFEAPDPDMDSWEKFEMGQYDLHGVGTLAEYMQLIHANWAHEHALTLKLVMSYLEEAAGVLALGDSKINKFYQMPEPDSDQAGKAWPSNRTWSMALRGLVAARCIGLGEDTAVTGAIVGGCVGKDIGDDFVAYVRKLSLPDPEDILTGKRPWVTPSRVIVTALTLGLCLNHVRKETGKLADAKVLKLLEIIQAVNDDGQNDVTPPLVQALISAGYSIVHHDPRVKEAIKAVTRDIATSATWKQLNKTAK